MGREKDGSDRPQLGLHQLPGEVFSQDDVEDAPWYECAPQWPAESDNCLRGTKSEWADLAAEALESASRMFEKKVNGSMHESRRVLDREKTIGDKIAAVALLVQASPVHRLDELYTLLSHAKKKGRGERGPAIDAMKDLFINDLLPDGRRLLSIQSRNFRCERSALSKRHLAYALFESELKTIYAEFLDILDESGKDSLAYFKQKSVKVIYDLLLAKPENEQTLLAMLVNKLGDPERKISSTAAYNLSELITKHHPQMRIVVVKEVEQLLLRPNIPRRAQYFAVSFLNNVQFKDKDVDLARRLVRLYMDMFTSCLAEEREENEQKKEEKRKQKIKRVKVNGRIKKVKQKVAKEKDDAKDSKLMGALLIGVNRAFPFTDPTQDTNSYDRHYKALYRVAHANSLEPATQALAFLFQVSQVNDTQSDRFYRALYSRVMDVAYVGDTAQAPFLNLVFQALKADTNPRRVRAFVKRLLQAGQCGASGFAASCVLVVSEALNGRHKGMLKSFVSLSEKDDDDECFDDANEDSAEEQDTATEKAAHQNGKKSKKNNVNAEDSDSEPELDGKDGLNGIMLDGDETPQSKSAEKTVSQSEAYDPSKREPQFARAENSALWEAVSLSAHYHPSISKFARRLCIDMKKVIYKSDPLDDFSDMAFLDKFVYKKAKNRLAKSLYGKKAARYRDEPIANSAEFQEKAKSGKVDESDMFFAKFFEANPDKVKSEAVEGARRVREGSDIDSEEEAFEEAMREEMRRMGADDGFFSAGINQHVPDIDEEDEDELKAFEAAFADEMVGSDAGEAGDDDDEDEGAAETEVLELPGFEEADSTDVPNEGDDSDEDEPPVKPKASVGSVFAPAEDYEQAIDEEIARSALADDGDAQQEEPSKKRKGGAGGKSKSKRRKKTVE